MILITGSAGLIGTAVGKRLDALGVAWRGFDLRGSASCDTRDPVALAAALEGVDGVVHLAAVSRVVWAENAPALAREVNVDALDSLVGLMHGSSARPWLIFASSREVYGEQAELPVAEDALLAPLNTYARTKVAGENLVEQAAQSGMRTQTVRFSNVYGSTDDHEDRVVPAFARAAAGGGEIRVDGSANMFDFTHVDDASEGLARAIAAMVTGENLPALHFLTGTGTTLGELAAMAHANARNSVSLCEAPPRQFDVARFVGDPDRARRLLGWEAQIPIDAGLNRLIGDFAAELDAGQQAPAVAGEVA